MEVMKFDIISRLPPEIVLNVTRYLSVKDFLSCCLVCLNWNYLFTSECMNAFWKTANEAAGFKDDYYRRRGIADHALQREIFKHKRKISDVKPEIKMVLGRYPFESTMKCEYAGKGYFVKTIDYSTLERVETIIGELCFAQRVIKKVDTMVGDHGSVSFAMVIGKDVVWKTSSERWFKYDTSKCTFHSLFVAKEIKNLGDTVGYCRHCLFLVTGGTENAMHGYSWNFTFTRVDKNGDYENPQSQQIKFPIPPGITQYIPRPVTAHLVPDDPNCGSHRLIMQGGTGGCVFKLTHGMNNSTAGGGGGSGSSGSNGGEIKLSPAPIGTLNPFYDSDIAVMVVNTTSKMTLSQDEQLIGMVTSVVYPFSSGLCLHIFELETYKRIVSVKVDWDERFNDAEVLCISRLYAVLGVGHSKGVIKIVNVSNGNVILMHSELSRGLPPVIPLARLLFVHYEGIYNEETLTDICLPFTLTIIYRKGVGNLEALYFHPFCKKGKSELSALLEKDSEDKDEEDEELSPKF